MFSFHLSRFTNSNATTMPNISPSTPDVIICFYYNTLYSFLELKFKANRYIIVREWAKEIPTLKIETKKCIILTQYKGKGLFPCVYLPSIFL